MDYLDIIGQKFGRLEVIAYDGVIRFKNEKKARSCYRCRCDCGKVSTIKRHDLISGKRTSCGDCCKSIMENDYYRYYDINGDSFIFDSIDLELVKKYRWRVDSYGYAVTRAKEDRKNHRLTRILLQPTENEYVDHINGNPRDNRRCNLRLASYANNQCNMKLPKHNTSGYKGVTYCTQKKKYRAQISVNNKTKHIGYFDSPEKAAKTYDIVAVLLFGEFACVNFPQQGEQGCRRDQENSAYSLNPPVHSKENTV